MKNELKPYTQRIAFRRTLVPVYLFSENPMREKSRDRKHVLVEFEYLYRNQNLSFCPLKAALMRNLSEKYRALRMHETYLLSTSRQNPTLKIVGYLFFFSKIIIIVMICVRSSDQHCSTNKPGLNCLPTESATSPTTLWSLFRYVLFFFFYARFPSLYFTRSLSRTLCLSVFTFTTDWPNVSRCSLLYVSVFGVCMFLFRNISLKRAQCNSLVHQLVASCALRQCRPISSCVRMNISDKNSVSACAISLCDCNHLYHDRSEIWAYYSND